MNKLQAIKLLESEGWTKADAIRALEVLDFNTNPDELIIRRTISSFAGSELIKRQRLQAAQKGMVTKKTNEIELKNKEYTSKIDHYKKYWEQENGKHNAENKRLESVISQLENKAKSVILQNEELVRINEQLKKDKSELVKASEQIKKDNNELVRVNEQLKKDNKDLKNIVDAIKLRLAIDMKNLLRYEDSEIRKALVKLFNSTLG